MKYCTFSQLGLRLRADGAIGIDRLPSPAAGVQSVGAGEPAPEGVAFRDECEIASFQLRIDLPLVQQSVQIEGE